MSLAGNDRSDQFTASAGETVFDATFPATSAAHVRVVRRRAGVETPLVLATDYTVSNLGLGLAARVTLTAGALAGDVYALDGRAADDSPTAFETDGDLRAPDLQAAFDYVYLRLQELRRDMARALQRAPTAPTGALAASGVAIADVGHLELKDMSLAVPAAPATGFGRLYAKLSSGVLTLFWRAPTGGEINLSQAASDATAAASTATAAASTAAGAATTAAGAATTAQAAAASINLPALAGGAMKLLRVKNDETGYEHVSAGAGDVTAAAAFGADNLLLRSDGTGKGAQASGIAIDDDENFSGLGYLELEERAAPANPAAQKARLYAKLEGGVTRLAYRNSAGTEVVLGSVVLPGYLQGLVLANNAVDAANDIDIAAGVAASDSGLDMMLLASSLTKRLDAAWAVGTNQGGLDTGAKAASTWYHVFAIKRPDTGVVDGLFSLSATAPTLPASYTLKRRIGAVRTDGSGNLIAFVQLGNHFSWVNPTLDVNLTTLDVTAQLVALRVPSGVVVEAVANIGISHASASRFVYVSPTFATDEAPLSDGNTATAVSVAGATQTVAAFRCWTNTSGQVRARSSGAATTFQMATLGWVDPL